MRLNRVSRSLQSQPITIIVIAIFLLLLWVSVRDGDVQSPPPPHLRRTLLKKLMGYGNQFIPANSPSFNYIGRWTATANQMRKDAVFPGTYVEFDITNTTSLYVGLRNVRKASSHWRDTIQANPRQLFIQPARDRTPPSAAVSLLVQVAGQALYFNQTGHGVLAISSNFDRTLSFRVRLTYLGPVQAGAILEFEGVWLDKGGQLVPDHTLGAAAGTTLGVQSSKCTISSPPQKHLEVITTLSYQTPKEAVNSWPQSLASRFNTSHAILPASSNCLTPTCSSSSTTFSDLYFRAGPLGTSYFYIPYRFGPPYPSALIIDLGVVDYYTFLRSKPSSSEMNHFMTTFVQEYVSLISKIRSTAYPYNSPYHTQQHSIVGVDASFTYNSAPSTLPILLLTPFTPSTYLHRLLSHAVSQTVNTVQKQGDKSTFWIDTSGWLSRGDFTQCTNPNDKDAQLGVTLRTDRAPALKFAAHKKITEYLSYHLCPYLSTPESTSSSGLNPLTRLQPD